MPDASILFADLAGFTALTEAHGDLAATELLERFYALAAASLTGGARLVKTIGDAVMIHAPSCDAAVETATRLRRAIDASPGWPALRVGVHCGPVLERGGDCFGATVNVAARVAAYAHAGQVLCTRATARAVDATRTFRPLGEVHFKNVHEGVEVFELLEAPAPASDVDPVCRMRLDAAAAPARLPYAGRTFSFCSFDCARAFAADPAAYAQNR